VLLNRAPVHLTPPPAVQTGTATVTSAPEGAIVSIDGTVRGKTPLRLALPAGDHTVDISVGAVRRSLPLVIDPGSIVTQHIEFAAAAQAQTGRLDIASDPPGAQVSVDGASKGVTPLSVASIAAGEHKITISSGDATIHRTVSVAPGATATVMATVTSGGTAAGWVSFKSPTELQVFEGGQLLGSTSTSRLMLPAGRHDFELWSTALEFRSTVSVQLAPGKTVAANVALPNGSLSLNAQPWADVTIDGRPAGTTPLGNLAVPIGQHEIVWRHPQLGERRQTVVVKAQSPTRVAVSFEK
jgi:hypothetical protein